MGRPSGSRRIVLEAHDRPDPALGCVHNYRPVLGTRGRAPTLSGVPRPLYVDAHGQLPDESHIIYGTGHLLLVFEFRGV